MEYFLRKDSYRGIVRTESSNTSLSQEIKTSRDFGKDIVDNKLSPSDIQNNFGCLCSVFAPCKVETSRNGSFWLKGVQEGDLQIYTETTEITN